MVTAAEWITALSVPEVENLGALFHFLTNKVMTMLEHAPLCSLLMQALFSRPLSASHCLVPTLARPSGNRYGRAEVSLTY